MLRIKVRYLSSYIAKCFGSDKKEEYIYLPDDAKYKDLLELFNKRYSEAIEAMYGDKYKEMILDFFIFISESKPVVAIKDKLIPKDCEVIVTYADLGG